MFKPSTFLQQLNSVYSISCLITFINRHYHPNKISRMPSISSIPVARPMSILSSAVSYPCLCPSKSYSYSHTPIPMSIKLVQNIMYFLATEDAPTFLLCGGRKFGSTKFGVINVTPFQLALSQGLVSRALNIYDGWCLRHADS